MERIHSNTAVVVIVATFSMLLLQACGGSVAGESDEGVRPDQSGELPVLLRNFSFEPAALLFDVGETVRFSLSSADGLHTFTVKDLDIDWRVTKKGESVTQSYTFDNAGIFKLICDIPGHRGSGMEGTVEVRLTGGTLSSLTVGFQ